MVKQRLVIVSLMAVSLLLFLNMTLERNAAAETGAISTTLFNEDFESFTGAGFDPNPTAGQLDSDLWSIDGLGTNVLFGGSESTGDPARGTSTGGVTSGGVYAFSDNGSTFFGIQPGGSDWTPGDLTLKITNTTGAELTSVSITYTVMVYNDQARGNTFNFAYSTDDSSYTSVPSLDFTSTEAADLTPAWEMFTRTTTINGLSIADNNVLYLQWNGDDSSGSGSRDEFGLDNVLVKANPADAADFTLQILHASDLEGGVEAIENAPNFAAIVDTLEQDTGNFDSSILLSAGDNYIPGPFFNAAGDRTTFRDGGVFNDTYNTLFGTTEFDSLREGNGRVDISIMNVMGFDASAIGNHEFDQGSDAFEGIIEEDFRSPAGGNSDRWVGSQFPYLSANLDFTSDADLSNLATTDLLLNTAFASNLAATQAENSDIFKIAPFTVISQDGEYIGVIGATTQLVETISSPGASETTGGSNDMTALAAVLNPLIVTIQNGLDGTASTADDINKIIVVSHLQQFALEQELIGYLNGVDIVIAGGSDTLLADATDYLRPGDTAAGDYPYFAVNADGDPAALVSTDGEYTYVGRLVVGFDTNGVLISDTLDTNVSGIYATDETQVISTTGQISASDAISNSVMATEVKKLVDAVSGVVSAKDGTIFGVTGLFIEGRREFVRTEETNMGNLTADANLAVAQDYDTTVAVSIKNGGGIRAEIGAIDGTTGALLTTSANATSGKQQGEISQLDIENSLRFNNGLTLMDLSYQELEYVLEHGVAATEDGATPGQFPQVGGLRFSFDPAGTPITFDTDGSVITDGTRIQSIALIDELGSVSTVIMEDGSFVASPTSTVRIVTLDFLWGLFSSDPVFGGDGYPFTGYGENVIQLGDVLTATGSATFADAGSEQDALAEYLAANHATVPYYTSDTPMAQDTRIQNLSMRNDAVTADVASEELNITNLSSFGLDGAEIADFDPARSRLFVTYGDGIQVVDLSNPVTPTLLMTLTHTSHGADSNDTTSVAVGSGSAAGFIAAGVPGSTTTDNGHVFFYSTAGVFVGSVEVGPLPDMVTFSPDGAYLLVANEGESADPDENAPGITPNPNGSVSIITLDTSNFANSAVSTYPFDDSSITVSALQGKGIRVHESAPSAAADLEPEYIAIEGTTAFVTLQENNAMAVIEDITNFSGFTLDDLFSLGTKDHTLPFNRLDPSNRDSGINLQNAPFNGLYMPDAIASFETGDTKYIVTANEGDGRGDADQTGGGDEARLKDFGDAGFPVLDAYAFMVTHVVTDVLDDAVFGRIKASSIDGDTDNDNDIDNIHTFGARSFSIYDENGTQVFDSGDLFARVTAAETPTLFNANDGIAAEFDDRSDDKGMEPEGVALGTVNNQLYAFIGLERAGGGVMIFNITDPADVQFVDYIRVDGDISPEGLTFVTAADSPNGAPLLIVAHEESNNIRVFALDAYTEVTPQNFIYLSLFINE